MLLAPPALVAPAPQVSGAFRLPTGLEVRWRADHQHPTFRLRLLVRPRAEARQGEAGARLNLLGQLLRDELAGMTTGSPLDLPAQVRAVWNGDELELEVESTTAYLEQVLSRLGTWLAAPPVPVEGVERLRGLHRILPTPALERLALQVAVQSCSRCEPPPPLPTEAQLDRIKVEELRTLYAEAFAPGRARLGLVGDLDPAQVRSLADRFLAAWRGAPEATPEQPQQPRGVTWFCDTGSAGLELRVGVRLFTPRGEGAGPGHLIPFLLRRLGEEGWTADPGTGFLRLRQALAPGAPEAGLGTADQRLESLAARKLDVMLLAAARDDWRTWRRALDLRPGERLAWLASEADPDAVASQVEACSLAEVQAAWSAAFQRSARQSVVVGADPALLEAAAKAGWPNPERIRVLR